YLFLFHFSLDWIKISDRSNRLRGGEAPSRFRAPGLGYYVFLRLYSHFSPPWGGELPVVATMLIWFRKRASVELNAYAEAPKSSVSGKQATMGG
ncbi:hypothetical protein CSUI_003190, partial [Cystoisospora suis]